MALLDSPISGPGTLETSGKGVRTLITAATAQSYGVMTDKNKTWPAIVFNQYGRGRSILYAFDLLFAPDHTQAAALLITGLNHVRPLERQPLALAGLPVRIRVTNASEPVDIKVIETIPSNTTAAWINPVTELLDNTLIWFTSLGAARRPRGRIANCAEAPAPARNRNR